MINRSKSVVVSAALFALLPAATKAQDAAPTAAPVVTGALAPDVTSVMMIFIDGSQQICAVDGTKGALEGTNGTIVKFEKGPGGYEYTTAVPTVDATGQKGMGVVKVLMRDDGHVVGKGDNGQMGVFPDNQAASFIQGFNGLKNGCATDIADTIKISANFPHRGLSVNEAVTINVPGSKIKEVIGLNLK